MTHEQEVALEIHKFMDKIIRQGLEENELKHFRSFSIDVKKKTARVTNDRDDAVVFPILLCHVECGLKSFMDNFRISTLLHALSGKKEFDLTSANVVHLDLSEL